jgi:hypothetical protein
MHETDSETGSPYHTFVEEKEIPHNLDRVLGVEGEGNVLTPNHALTINSSQMIGGLVIGHKRHQHGGEHPNGARSLTCSTQRRTSGEGGAINRVLSQRRIKSGDTNYWPSSAPVFGRLSRSEDDGVGMSSTIGGLDFTATSDSAPKRLTRKFSGAKKESSDPGCLFCTQLLTALGRMHNIFAISERVYL